MEDTCMHLIAPMQEYKYLYEVRQVIHLPSLAPNSQGIATPFNVGMNCQSVVHTDAAYFSTFLPCLGANHENHDKVTYYFCYPKYKIAMPMQSADLIIFNALKWHCCSNCRYNDS